MTIPVMNFPEVDIPDQTSPLMTGLMSGLKVYSAMFDALSAPGKANAEAQESQAKLGLTKAQTDLTNAQTQKMLVPEQPKAQSDIGKMLSDYDDIKSTYGESSPQAQQFGSMLKQKMDEQQSLINYRGSAGNYMQARQQALPNSQSPQIAKDLGLVDLVKNGHFSMTQAKQIQANPDLAKTLKPEGTQSDLDAASIIDSYVRKEATPTYVQKAQYASTRADELFSKINTYVDKGALDYYNGLKGDALKVKDIAQEKATGKTPDRLIANRLMNASLQQVKGEAALQMNVPADQLSRGEFGQLFDLDKYAHSKAGAIAQLEAMHQTMNTQGGVTFESMDQLLNRHKEIAKQFEEQEGAQKGKEGLKTSPEEVNNLSSDSKNKLGIKSVNIPEFNSNEEFNSWLNSQPINLRPAIRLEIERKNKQAGS